jgi:hypothetical protein
MKPGTSGSLTILYHVLIKWSAYNPQSKLVSADVPAAFSVTSVQIDKGIRFSDGTLIFQYNNWTEYRYTITASSNSTGYYALLIPYGFKFYPALVIGVDPSSLNASILSMWGYDGLMVSGETSIPSDIVGITNMSVINQPVPITSTCPNAACVRLSHDYYS